MTYIVLDGALNSTHSFIHSLIRWTTIDELKNVTEPSLCTETNKNTRGGSNEDGRILTMVRKMPNSGSMLTTSPSVKTNCDLRSFLHVRTMAICCAATDNAANSMRLNSSKHPHDPDIDSPAGHITSEEPVSSYDRCSFITVYVRP